MLIHRTSRMTGARGFSLIELMVALALGLIVISAVLALVLSIMRSNNQTIAATRLTQELRATAAVISSEIKRARSVSDPLTAAKQGNAFDTIDATTANCLIYGYAGAAGGGFHVINLDQGKVVLAVANALPADCSAATIASGAQQLSSRQVNIATLTFEPAADPECSLSSRCILVSITGWLNTQGGSLVSDPDAITRTITQPTFVRSIGD